MIGPSIKIERNWLARWSDSIIESIAPTWGAKRRFGRMRLALSGGYLAGRRDRLATKEWVTLTNSADADLIPDLPVMRDRSRDLVRNAPLAASALNTAVQNVVGSGLTLQARPDWEALDMSEDQAAEWAAKVEREFRLFAERPWCDITWTQNFYELQDLVFRSTLESGDVFVLLTRPAVRALPAYRSPYQLKLQVIEADRVETPRGQRDSTRLAGGVELDEYGAPVAYHILRKHPGNLDGDGALREGDRWPAFNRFHPNVLHVFQRLRPGQNRGVPWYAPIVEMLKQLTKYGEAELAATVLGSLFAVFIETPSGEGLGQTVTSTGELSRSTEQEIKLGSGSVIDLRPGEKIATASVTRPNSAFEPFVEAMAQQIGGALGLPFEVLFKRFTASYSAARAALLDAWIFYRNRRVFLATKFCQPVYEAWMWEAVMSGRIDAPGFMEDPARRAYFLQAEWIGDSPGQIDPVKEVEAAAKRLEIGVSTHEDETRLLTGKVWEDQLRQRAKEERLMKEAGLGPAAAAPAAAPGAQPAQPSNERPEEGDTERPEDERQEESNVTE